MTDTTPLTSQQLDDIETRAASLHEYATLTDEPFQADADELTGVDVPALLAEVRRLQTGLAAEERLHGDTIDERDRATDMADKLAYAIASETVIGEHTADNSPWANALELITSAADVDKLRARVRELERPAVEAKRNEIRQSYTELISQAEEDRDPEGAFDVQVRLREREEQWAQEDAAVRSV
ncbi:hypothetical protein OOK29_09540 [Streptomyces phaeochromogenes]|uniref:hypothetical protein n=1 Tax=Streptomyces phaeochromogenes TaxID=1923 RepID=UPI002253C953|nr:hypothetical protein [Streptomyces phaeochromogenes]MCX5598379.1 hypothetical protein [Streptomyces phaeochromogenes]